MKDQITKMGKESKNGLAKQGLNLKRRIRPKISFFGFVKVRANRLGREKEEGRRRREGKPR